MNTRISALLIGIGFGLATGGVSQAMSHLVSLSVEPEWPATSDPGNVVTYNVTVTRTGEGMLSVDLSAAGLPEGADVSFSPNPVRFTGRVPETLTATLTITCTNATPTDSYAFTVTGEARRESVTVTNQPGAIPKSLSPSLPTLALDPLGPAGMKIRGIGAGGSTYQVEATSDLGKPSWTSIGSCTADGNGRFTFTDAQAKDYPVRFYRAVLPAPGGAAAH